MAFTENQYMFAMYVIGEVESNWNWASVNYNDPITLGMMQWYGTRAAALLNRLKAEEPDDYAKLAQSLRDSVDAHAATDTWWTTRYLTKDEGESWGVAAQSDGCHRMQQDQFINDDMPGYIKTFEGWGASTDNPQAIIFMAAMYHQGPRYCGQVVQAVGGSASLDALHNACLNNRVLGQYRNRYNTVYNRLKAWDGTSAPPDFGQVDVDVNPGGDPSGSGATNQAAGIQAVTLAGDGTLVVIDTSGNKTICFQASTGLWYPRVRSTAPPNPGGGTSGGGGGSGVPSGDFEKMFQLWKDHEKQWSYGQGPGRLNPIQSGYSDCSACIWWAINSVRPDLAANIGTWTGAMSSNGTEIARGTTGQEVDESKLKPGDIVLIEWGRVNWSFNDASSHVEWYVGNGELWGAGSSPLPHDSGSIHSYITMGKVGCWMVRRVM